MNENLRLGRIAGIPIGINWSVLVVLWLLAWSLAAGYLPDAEPGYRSSEYWAVGVVAALVFLISLLAHELAHALVALRAGVGVTGITLWLFGGVSKLDREASTPAAELRIALAGPAVSLSVAGIGGAAAVALDAIGAPRLLIAALAWLATINLILGVFNLIPAAPLDGGRVLRAVLWQRRGDHLSASLSAANAGRFFGFVLIGLGLLQALAGLLVGGLWLVFLGWFLLSAARAEQTHALLFEALADVPVRRIMSSPVVTVGSGVTLRSLIDDLVMQHPCSAFAVTDREGRSVGLITLAKVKGVSTHLWSTTTVGDICTPIDHVVRATPDELAVQLLTDLSSSADGRALVMDDDRLVGVVTPTDVVRMSEMAMLRAGT
ncbi:MAG: site-2 protease family protein [Microthrixaceae bacterium]